MINGARGTADRMTLERLSSFDWPVAAAPSRGPSENENADRKAKEQRF